MDIASLLREGAQLTALGMFVVFVLLSLLVLSTKGMSRLAMLMEARLKAQRSGEPLPFIGGDSELIAVVTAAIHAHRNDASH